MGWMTGLSGRVCRGGSRGAHRLPDYQGNMQVGCRAGWPVAAVAWSRDQPAAGCSQLCAEGAGVDGHDLVVARGATEGPETTG